MADDTYQRLQALIAMMSPAQLDALEQAIRERRGGGLPPVKKAIDAVSPTGGPIETIEAAFLTDPLCPHCQSKKLQKGVCE